MSQKIIIVGPAHPLRGGLASFNERLARAFIHNGDEVSIYTFSLQYPGFLFPGTTQYSSEPTPVDLKILPIINSVNPLNWLKIGKQLKNENADLVIVRYWLPFMGPCLGTILRKVKKNNKTKIVCIADNVIPHESRPGDTIFTKYFIKPIDAFITMSKKVMNDLRSLTNKPATQVHHPLYDNFGDKISMNEARTFLKIDPNEKIILFFGFIRKYKGLDILLESMRVLKKHKEQHPDFNLPKLLIAGEYYEDEKYYLQLIEQYDLKDNVIAHTNFIPDSEVKYYLCAADVVVQPYRNATQSGVTPLAYHFEIPMIVTRVGSLPDLVPHEKVGLVTEPDAHTIADTIIKYFNSSYSRFIAGLKEEKLKYTWQALVDEIKSLPFNR